MDFFANLNYLGSRIYISARSIAITSRAPFPYPSVPHPNSTRKPLQIPNREILCDREKNEMTNAYTKLQRMFVLELSGSVNRPRTTTQTRKR